MLQMSVPRDYAFNLNAISSVSATDPLRRWLEGRWALLFSHPRDFGSAGFETDRWLVYVRDAFANLRLRPIGVGFGDGTGWISQAGGRLIPHYVADELLPSEQLESSEHFVTILDSTLRARRTLLYRPGHDVPCAIELAQTAARLRARGAPASVRRILQGI